MCHVKTYDANFLKTFVFLSVWFGKYAYTLSVWIVSADTLALWRSIFLEEVLELVGLVRLLPKKWA